MKMPMDFRGRAAGVVRRTATDVRSGAASWHRASSRLLLAAALATGWGAASHADPTDPPPQPLLPAADTQLGQNGFVVLELFSSEGCSGCPKAEAWLNHLSAEAREKKLPVYCLAYQVDYWNNLRTPHGVWKDPFSSVANSNRQTQYARARAVLKNQPGLAKGRVTPQFVLDAFRSQSQKGETTAQTMGRLLALDRPVSVSLAADAKPSVYRYTARHVPEGCHLLVALVERGLVQEVEGGENAGKKLTHDQVVREFKTHPLEAGSPGGELPFPLPAGVKPENCSLIAYVQDADTLEIHGATAFDLPAATPAP